MGIEIDASADDLDEYDFVKQDKSYNQSENETGGAIAFGNFFDQDRSYLRMGDGDSPEVRGDRKL